MALTENEAHEKALALANTYKEVNKNTVYQYQQQTEADKKMRIRRIAVVKRDERASEITKLIKTETQSHQKENAYKRGKVPSNKEKKENKGRKKVSNYFPVPHPEKLQSNTLIGQTWELYEIGWKTPQIADKLGVSRRYASSMIYKRKRQLAIDPKQSRYERSKTKVYYDLYLQGISCLQIGKQLNVSPQTVSGTIARHRKKLGLSDTKSPLTLKVQKLKKEGKGIDEISEILQVPRGTVKYHFYTK